MDYFTEDELKCSHTGECKMDDSFMYKINTIRKVCDFPFTVTSAYKASGYSRPTVWSY